MPPQCNRTKLLMGRSANILMSSRLRFRGFVPARLQEKGYQVVFRMSNAFCKGDQLILFLFSSVSDASFPLPKATVTLVIANARLAFVFPGLTAIGLAVWSHSQVG